jgi:toxin ParE1/3/4
MTQVRLSPRAVLDLDDIGAYVAAESPIAALRLVTKLNNAALELADYPRRYPLVASHQEEGARMRPVGSYTIFYVVDDREGVIVLRVLHAARDRDALLGP